MINKYYVDKKDMGVTWTDFVNTDSHGSRNTVFRMSIVLPILESVSDTSSNYCSGYIGVMYNNPFWGELKGQELEDKRREYWSNWLSDFENRKVETFVYLDRVEKSYQLEGFTQASRRSKKKCSNYNNIFIAVNAPFENRYNENIKDFLLAFIIGSLAFLGIILIPKLDTKKLYKFQGETSE